MRYGIVVPSILAPETIVELGVTSERRGWDGVFVWDTLLDYDVWVLLTAVAMPSPSLIRPRRTCSVPTKSWRNRPASSRARMMTRRARSVNRSNTSFPPPLSCIARGRFFFREQVVNLGFSIAPGGMGR